MNTTATNIGDICIFFSAHSVVKKSFYHHALSLALFFTLFLFSAVHADIKSSSGNINFDMGNDGTREMKLTSYGLQQGADTSQRLGVSGNMIVSGNLTVGGTSGNSTLNIKGTLAFNVQTVSSNTTLGANAVILVDTASANVKLTLPTASTVVGRIYKIKKIGQAGFVRVTGSANIEGYNSYYMYSSNIIRPYLEVVAGADNIWKVLVASDGTSPVVGGPHLTGWWKLDEESSNTTAADSSKNGNDGTRTGATVVAGKIGNAISCDGANDYVDTNSGTLANLLNTFTISAWIKSTYSGTNTVAVGKYSGAGASWWLGFVTPGQANFNATDSASVNDGNWHLLTGTFSLNGDQRMYVDGVLKNFTAVSATVSPTGDMHIGVFGTALTFDWDGQIDDVRMYSRDLMSEEIKALYDEAQ